MTSLQMDLNRNAKNVWCDEFPTQLDYALQGMTLEKRSENGTRPGRAVSSTVMLGGLWGPARCCRRMGTVVPA